MQAQRFDSAHCPSLAIRGLILDDRGVLYDATLIRRQLFRYARRYGISLDFEAFFDRWENEFFPAVCRAGREYQSALREFLSSHGLTAGQIDELRAACGPDFQDLEAGRRPLPGVKQTLRRLVDVGVSLAVLADSPHSGSVLGDRLEQIGLRGYFVAVLTSRDFSQRPSLAAANEPASDDFAAALDALVLPAGDVAFVSHHSGKRGSAVRAGIRAIALGGKAMSGADIQILRFEELLRHARVASSRGIAC